MNLTECEKNKKLKIISLDIDDYKLKLRLSEIGFFVGSNIMVLNISSLKQTLLVGVLDSCFALKRCIAEKIEVEYD